MDEFTKIYWLLEDCKRYGTLPFAGLARAGFVAVQILNSMVAEGILTVEQRYAFLNGLDSISSQMGADLKRLDKEHFLHKYGHLRPGTYDILSPRYDEAPDLYFDWKTTQETFSVEKEVLQLSLDQLKKIKELLDNHGLDHDVIGLFSFIKSSIEGREYSKYLFTKTVSDILHLLKSMACKMKISTEDVAFLNIQDILKLYSSSWNIEEEIRKSISSGKNNFESTKRLILPPLICNSEEIYCFKWPESKPNFITNKSVTAHIKKDLKDTKNMAGAVVFIPSADPGFDWIFTHNIAGFVTAYGGVNSHMAIRAGELSLPAIIGAGETLFNDWSKSSKISINCLNQTVEVF